MSKVFIISSSMRKGNSDILCDEFEKGAKDSNNIVDRINLRDLKIDWCLGCSACQETGKCVRKDDMSKFLDKIKEADVLVLATPVYFGEISGQLKVFIDRLYPIYTSLKAKKAIVIMSCYQNSKKHIDESFNTIKRFLKDANNIPVEKVVYGENCDDPKDVHIKQRQCAYACGKGIK